MKRNLTEQINKINNLNNTNIEINESLKFSNNIINVVKNLKRFSKYGLKLNKSFSKTTQLLQKALIFLGYDLPKHGADGYFGKETKNALKKYIRNIQKESLNEDASLFRSTLNSLGYDEKGNEIDSGGPIHDNLSSITSSILKTYKKIKPNVDVEVTAGNDKYHHKITNYTSMHTLGLALDVTLHPYNKENANAFMSVLKKHKQKYPQLSYLNEYEKQTKHSTGSHIHIQLSPKKIKSITKPIIIKPIIIKSLTNDLMKKYNTILSQKNNKKEKENKKIYNIPGDKTWSYAVMGDNQWHVHKKDWSENKWYNLSKNSKFDNAITKLDKIFPNARDIKKDNIEKNNDKKDNNKKKYYTELDLSTKEGINNYKKIADFFINRRPNPLNITGDMIANGAKMAYNKYGAYVPPELSLSQLAAEGGLSNKLNSRPIRTKNPYNIGNVDSGKNKHFNNVQSAIYQYFNLIARKYLSGNKNPNDLLRNFVNDKGQRYASNKQYETLVSNIARSVKKIGENFT